MATTDSPEADTDDVCYDAFDGSNCRHLEATAPPGTDCDQRFSCTHDKMSNQLSHAADE